ncbi:MAG: M6 family metalloprotease domain-containing protein [Elusimicrobia bacterium]|nr:M6 family metalloprotease domain-containing protein [Elusimicrobiota bacterium]
MAPPPAWQGMPTTGPVKMFVLLIRFSDMAESNTQAEVDDKVFGDGNGNYPYESLKEFYTRSSYGLLTLQGATLGWYNTGAARSAIAETDAGREGLIEDAIDSFDAGGHDFSVYDNNGDGKIDYFAVIWTGPAGAWASFWWGYMTTWQNAATPLGYTVDGKTLAGYSWQWESSPSGGTFWPDTLIHETGHALGLPDYYDYDDSVGPDGGVGGLDMMHSYGDHNAFSKWMLEWLAPANVPSGSLAVTLRPAASYADAVKIMPSSDPSNAFEEYFMVQNRTQAGNDQGLPGSGLVIWHVDARLDGNGNDFLYDNSYAEHKLLRLMEADGLEEIENNLDYADAGDFYASGKLFGSDSTPNSKKYDGTDTRVFVSDIAGTDDSRTLTCGTDYVEMPVKADLEAVRTYPNPARLSEGGQIRFVDIPYDAKDVKIQVFTVGGKLVRTLDESRGTVTMANRAYKVGVWDGRNDSGEKVASGVYMVVVRASNKDAKKTKVGVFW